MATTYSWQQWLATMATISEKSSETNDLWQWLATNDLWLF
jgi:hypothetical protein